MVKKVLETQAKENQDKSRLVSQASQTQEPTFQVYSQVIFLKLIF